MISSDISDCNKTQRFFTESRLMLIICKLIFLEFKRRYSVLLRLVDNMLTTNKEKTPLMQDSIIDVADDACSRENEIYI